MDRQTLIRSLAESPDDQVLLARIWDRMSAGARKNIPSSTCFLTGREQILASRLCTRGGLPEPVMFGGYDDAERKTAVYVPDYYDPDSFLRGEEGPVAALRVSWTGGESLSHRDFLGSLMGQGIKREIIGDLLPTEGKCDILVLREMAGYLTDSLTQVGRARVQILQIPLQQLQVPERRVRLIRDTVASLRLDSVLGSGFQLSRSKAANLITAGNVSVNHFPVLKPDAPVAEGDVISARGLGKIQVSAIGGRTKKGRIGVELERFL